jgi:HflC protein
MSPLPINHPLLHWSRRLADSLFSPLGAIAATALAVLVFGCAYTVDQTEQVVLTQFGRPVGEAINSNAGGSAGPGLHFKIPFVQQANRFEKRILEWDGVPNEMTTRDKLYVVVDTFARWRIVDPLVYFQSLRDERSALSRIDDIIGSETRNVVARHDLIELVRSDKTRKPEQDATIAEASATIGTMRGPSAGSFIRLPSIRTKAIVVDISRPSAPSANAAQRSIGGTETFAQSVRRTGIAPPSASRLSRR